MCSTNVVLCVLFISSTIALPKEVQNVTANESQAASVQEVSHPPMTVQNASPQDYLLPSYYTFNKGEPFYVEKDPLTGAIDFNKKTTPTSADKIESNTSSGIQDEKGGPSDDSESDYFYDDQEFADDSIDRKDGNIEGPNIYRPNDIFQNPYKISPDLHQFLNLPVHYSSGDKFPLISSSYANTKVQGTGSASSYSNHKYVTTSTQSPSYYTMPTSKYTTPKTQYQSSTIRSTTTPSTTKLTSTTTEAEEEYENTDYNEYEGEDSDTLLDNQAVPSEHHTYKPDTTRYTVTTYRPTTFRFTTTTSTAKPKTSSVIPITENSKQQVSIVTSLPLDIYYSTSQKYSEPSSTISTSTTLSSTSVSTATANTTNDLISVEEEAATNSPSQSQKYNTSPSYNVPGEGFYQGFGEEPFRPIFGTSDTPFNHEANNKIQYNKNEYLKPKPEDYNEFHRLPPHQNIPYIQNPTLPPEMEPPKPDAPQSFFPDQPVKLVPGQHTSITFSDSSQSNTISRPIKDSVYERPPPFIKDATITTEYKPQNPAISTRPDNHPVYNGWPSERPISSVKPRPPQEFPVKSNFKVPSKIENHFIKVSPDQENPSYSLQTSFSIGVPASSSQEENKDSLDTRPSQGVGQVFFPDNTPAENNPPDVTLPSQVLRPPNSRVPIQSYQPNRPVFRQPIHIQARPPPPYRVPNEDPPHQFGETDNYPRPHWENHNKPFYNPIQNAIPKKDVVLPQNYPGLSRGKPENIQRSDLPNILPQFRPNAKLGHVDYHQPFGNPGDRMREPLDTLQPPPLPQPQHLRINRNDDESEIEREIISGEIKVDPLVHRRSGPQPSRVTTLQMMQNNPQRKSGIRPEFPLENRQSIDKEKPVFLVYPSSHGMTHKSPPEEVVVIGTRAQRPIPPANLEKDDLDSFPLDDNKHFPIPGRDRVDTPILKTKLPSKPLIKNDFPYPIVKPLSNNNIPEERILSAGSITKEYTAFSPTPASSTEENKDHDSEINLIPYLQDYMPFATKKPQNLLKPSLNMKKETKVPQKPIIPNQVISTTLNASMSSSAIKTSTERAEEKRTENHEKKDSEMTVSATMYTQQRPANHKVPVTYTPSEPQPVGFQAPFMASLSAPESQGWTVVTDKNLKPLDLQEESTNVDTEDSKFDIENFKPQLFGGFKPILPSSEEDSKGVLGDKDKDVLLNKGDREERAVKNAFPADKNKNN